MQDFIIGTYFISLTILFLFGSSGFVMIYYYLKHRHKKTEQPGALQEYPRVTIQLPLFNEYYVAVRLIDAACEIDYPVDRLEIQVLDDSTDETVEIVGERIDHYKTWDRYQACPASSRAGYKAGRSKRGWLRRAESSSRCSTRISSRRGFPHANGSVFLPRPEDRPRPDPVGAS